MISESVKHGVDFIFTKAAKANLVATPGDNIEITPVPPLHTGKLVHTPEKHLIVLTISSYLFRLMVIFHVDMDKASRAYFAAGNAEANLEEILFEKGNLCCGAMNRDLGNYFPHMGMSTLYMLDRQCVDFLSELKPNYVSQHKIVINGDLTMHATLCMSSYASVDFRVDTSIAEEETGALEMF